MCKHHPVTKTTLWKAVMRGLGGSPSYAKKHAQKLLKRFYEASPAHVNWNASSFLGALAVERHEKEGAWLLHRYICKQNGWPILTWSYV